VESKSARAYVTPEGTWLLYSPVPSMSINTGEKTMKCRKQLVLTGYTVKYVDLRESKPRPLYTEVFTLEKADSDALAALGMNVANFITDRYKRSGYHVTNLERINSNRHAFVDLYQLWEQSAPVVVKESPVITSDMEVRPE